MGKVKNKNRLINWISFFSALGSLLAGIGTFWTLIYLNKQYKTSIKPDIVINNESAIILAERFNTNGYIHFYSANDFLNTKQVVLKKDIGWYTLPINIEFNSLYLKLHNIGLGVAKDVNLKWSFDTLKIIEIFNRNRLMSFVDSIAYKDRRYVFYNKRDTNYYYEFDWALNNRIKYLLPTNDSKDLANCRLPYLYLRMYSFYELLNFHIQDESNLSKEVIGDFPNLFLDLTYSDIGNNAYSKSYCIKLKMGNSSYGDFKLKMNEIVILDEIKK